MKAKHHSRRTGGKLPLPWVHCKSNARGDESMNGIADQAQYDLSNF